LANIKSQIKRNRQNNKRRLTNRVYRGEARIAVKEARTAIDTSAPESKAELLKAISSLDKAAEKGVIHKNNAARRKSRLTKAFNAMKPVEVKVEEPKAEIPVEPEAKPRRTTRVKAEPKVAAKAKAETKTEPKAKTPAKAAVKAKPAKTTATRKKPSTEK
jgi:small subunit ribosomal protein S20